jgi:hypothetical protein
VIPRWHELLLLVALAFPASWTAVAAQLVQDGTLSEAEWEKLGQRVALLDRIAYIPSVLPVIMKNRNALDLSDAQVEQFRAWYRRHYDEMVAMMNAIIARRIELSQSALDPRIDSTQLLADQQVILRMQEDLLRLRLSCRDLMVKTFTAEQWNDFAFVLETYPHLAGLVAEPPE